MRGRARLTDEIARGAIAGAVATWLMGRLTAYLYETEDPTARRREDSARGGRTSYETAAEKAAHALGFRLSERARRASGSGIHWALGIGTGALYGLLRYRFHGVDWAHGLGFGAAFWLLMDELIVPAVGLTSGPLAFPWQTHARGLAGHLAYGLAAEGALDVMDRVA
ncbi:MAG: DUF1440 domain-containing protein [Gemmatimonadota bacterium]